MIESREMRMRRRLVLGEGTNEFPLLADLAAEGGTDYWARIVGFGERGSIGDDARPGDVLGDARAGRLRRARSRR